MSSWRKGLRGFSPIIFAGILLNCLLVLLFPHQALACGNGILQAYTPVPQAPENKYFLCLSSGWNAVGIRAQPGLNYDLEFNNKFAISSLPEGEIDIVLVDANHSNDFRQFVRVEGAYGQDYYTIEWAPSIEVLGEGSFGPFTAEATSILRTWDISLTNEELYHVAISTDSPGANLGFALFHSDDSNSETFFQSREDQVAENQIEGEGSEFLALSPETLDQFGLVVWNNSALTDTDYWIFVDSSPPGGHLVINEDALFTAVSPVEVQLTLSDEETGIAEICLANDQDDWNCNFSVTDTQIPWQIEGTDGLNTVSARITNRAGMTTILTDTIFLDKIPPSASIIRPLPGRDIIHQPAIMFSGILFDEFPSSGVKDVDLQIEAEGASGSLLFDVQPTFDNTAWNYQWNNLPAGLSQITALVTATDNAGNQSVVSSVSWDYVLTGTTFLPIMLYQPFLPAGCISGENNSFETAAGPLQLNVEYCGYLDDPYDYYTFSLSTTTTVKIRLVNQGPMFPHQPTWPPNNIIVIYRDDQSFITSCCETAKFGLSISRSLGPGDYYLLAYAIDINSTISYTLKIEN